jgi:hypothetical protein
MRIKLSAIFLVCVIISFLSACNPGPPAQTPTLISLSVPGAVPPDYGNVAPSTSGSFSILPLFWSPTARITNPLRLVITAPYPSGLTVTVVDPATGTTVGLPQIDPNSAGPSTGYYQIGNVDPGHNPPQWTLTLQLPGSLISKTALHIQIVDVSANSNLTGQQLRSAPLDISLVSMTPDYTLTIDVQGPGPGVQGPGHVQSKPNGILCGADPLGGANLKPCTYNFHPPVPPFPVPFQVIPVDLNPNSNQNAHFVGWAGACTGKVVCSVILTGIAKRAVAVFAADPVQTVGTFGQCLSAPDVPGLTWQDVPACVDPLIKSTLSCDSKGYICCGTSGLNGPVPNSRCPGGAQEIQPKCSSVNSLISLQLIQPGGCYARSSP